MIKKLFLFLLTLTTVHIQSEPTSHLKKVLLNPALKTELGKFIDNVLKQTDSKSFFKIVDTMDIAHAENDSALYQMIQSRSHELLPRIQLFKKLFALNYQKTVLSKQLRSLIHKKHISGSVEIGTPGTYLSSIAGHIKLSNDIYVINDKQRITDTLQAFSLKPLNGFVPNNRFVQLHNYDPIMPADIPDNSVNMVICTIGLHHIPQEKLDGFIKSLHRILRPNGIFILREHDASGDDLVSLVSSAHSIFNILMTQESLQSELSEYRNFRPLSYWIDLLAQHGFTVDSQRLLQQGDPTYNTLLKFTKIATGEPDKLYSFSQRIQKKNPHYKRALMQTYLTSPEWINVDISKEYAQFIDHTPFYEFPYMKSVKTYWDVFGHSLKIAARKQGYLKALFNSYTLMNLFIGTTMTLEYSAKSLISFPLRLAFSGEEAGTIQCIAKDPRNELNAFDSVKIINTDPATQLMLIDIPRYKKGTELLQKLKSTSVSIYEIAGQKEIQVKIRTKVKDFNTMNIGKTLYSWSLPTAPDYFYFNISIPVENLMQALRLIEHQDGEIIYIHDF